MAESKLEIETSSEDVDKYCDACKMIGERNVAVVYCKTCKQYQCDMCNGTHKRIAALKGHIVVDVNDKAAGIVAFDMQGIDKCGKHNKKLKFYCKDHSKLCCSTCVISSHLKCGDVAEIDTYTNSNKDNLDQLQTSLQNNLFKSSVVSSTIPRLQTDLRKNQDNDLQKIDKIKKKVIQLFDTFIAEFKSNTDKAIVEVCKTLDSELTTCKELDVKMRHVESFLDGVAKQGTPAQVFSAINVYTIQVGQFLTSLEQSQSMLSTLNTNLKIHEKLMQFVEMTDTIATLSVEKIGVFIPMELSRVASVHVKASGDDKGVPMYSGIDFHADGRVLAVDNFNDKCVVMDGNLSILGQTKLENKPCDVTIYAGNKVAISHGNAIGLHTLNKDHTLLKSRTLQTKDSFFSLYPLDDDTLVASTYECDRPVKLMNLTGEEKHFDLTFPTKRYSFDQSKTTYSHSQSLLVLTDMEAHTCYLWNMEQKTSIIVEDERIKKPMAVCATSSGLIFVCSYATGSIFQISPTGKVLGSFRLETGNPHSLAVSRDDKHLLVLNSTVGHETLQLFKLTQDTKH